MATTAMHTPCLINYPSSLDAAGKRTSPAIASAHKVAERNRVSVAALGGQRQRYDEFADKYKVIRMNQAKRGYRMMPAIRMEMHGSV